MEKMELNRQVRVAEKEAQGAKSTLEELSKLRSEHSKLREEVRDLKEMIDEGSAFEQMVEDLSDRVMSLEEENINLESTVRDLEEGMDINNAMEEAQADEIKALMKDLQIRETVIVNLEEAIKA